MDFKATLADVSRNFKTGRIRVTFEANEDISKQLECVQDKPLSVTTKLYRHKRSLDANAYAWVLMQRIAETIHSDKWSVYLDMLGSYGVFTHIIVKPSVVSRVTEEWREVKNLGEVTVGGQTGIQLQCYFGSSTYDTREMSVFLDGIVRECRELNIETATPDEVSRMKQEWGVEL